MGRIGLDYASILSFFYFFNVFNGQKQERVRQKMEAHAGIFVVLSLFWPFSNIFWVHFSILYYIILYHIILMHEYFIMLHFITLQEN